MVDRVQPRGEADDLYVALSALWRTRRGRVRVLYRAAVQADVAELAAVAEAADLADAVLIEAAPSGAPGATGERGVQFIASEELVGLLQGSAMPAWTDGMPAVDAERFQHWTDLQEMATFVDPSGLRWLPTLALNKLPAELAEHGEQPSDLFEDIAFRVFTRIFRFGGVRMGAAARGERVPDGLLHTPGCTDTSRVVLDCKAAQDGYVMSVNDERALTEYCQALANDGDVPVSHVLIVSSGFPGSDGDRHPYTERARTLRQRGVSLVYMSALDIVRLAVEMEHHGLSPAERDGYPWQSVFDKGLVSYEDLVGALA